MSPNLSSIIKKVLARPPHITIQKAVRRYQQRSRERRQEILDLNSCTRIEKDIPVIKNSYVDIQKLDISGIDRTVAEYLAKMYIQHRFDLLGSGWVKNGYTGSAAGLEGCKYDMNLKIDKFDTDGTWLESVLLPSHTKESRKIWRKIDPDYIPIDWQKDFKSGFRWSTKIWHKKQFVNQPGADIIVPWELARLQHLLQMALLCPVLPEYKDTFITEFKNQVLDFFALSPPRMGVNWVCTMDVAIRAANILLAYDLFSQMDNAEKVLDEVFKKILAGSICEHGLHIINNLEWSQEVTTNHYLADIAGLIFVAAYLDGDDDVDGWLAFGLQELTAEFKRQFYDDGGNYESSTPYHRLSMEIIIYATAILRGLKNNKLNAVRNYDYRRWDHYPRLKPLNKQEYKIDGQIIFPRWYIERLYRAGLFTQDLIKPTGEIPQIGDNDNGRFFRLSPNGRFSSGEQAAKKYVNLKDYQADDSIFWDENILNPRTTLSALDGLFESSNAGFAKNDFPLEKSLVESLHDGKKFEMPALNHDNVSVPIGRVNTDIKSLKNYKETIITPPYESDTPLTHKIKLRPYPQSGIYIFKSERIHLTVTATPAGQGGLGGHSHNDKLSFELNIDGDDIIVDPGTYLYTPLPEIRNHFRSVSVHNTAIVEGQEQNRWYKGPAGLFFLKGDCRTAVLELTDSSIMLQAKYRGIIHIRNFVIEKDKIIIHDYCNRKFRVNLNRFDNYANGYGKLVSISYD